MSNTAQHAVVLSGGGATGAYEVGVLEALLERGCDHVGGEPLDPGIYSGTSVGSFNAAVMACRPGGDGAASVRDLERIWLEEVGAARDTCGNGVFRIRGDVLRLLDPRCLAADPLEPLTNLLADGVFLSRDALRRAVHFAGEDAPLLQRLLEVPDIASFVDTAPLRELVERHVDIDRLRQSDVELIVVATEWQKVRPRVFSKQEIVDGDGHAVILASTAIPAIFPPVAVDDDLYVDGGVTINTPLKPVVRRAMARGAGALTAHVVFLDPKLQDLPLPEVPSTYDTANRLLIYQLSDRLSTDIGYAAEVNERLARAREDRRVAQAAEKAVAKAKARRPTAFGRAMKRLKERPTRERIPLTIHIYRPRTDLGGILGLLDFRRAPIERLIEQGLAETLEHDCSKEGCVLA